VVIRLDAMNADGELEPINVMLDAAGATQLSSVRDFFISSGFQASDIHFESME
jgi:hypothetical protein